MTDTINTDAVKITALELESVKRIKVLEMIPEANGLTIIGGGNAQGKTTVLDGICYALGGERYRPGRLMNKDTGKEPYMRVELSNGLTAERKGSKSALKVTCPNGDKGNQKILDDFIEKLALDLPKFMALAPKEKAKIILKIIGCEEKLNELDGLYNETYDNRAIANAELKQAKAELESAVKHASVPEEEIKVDELLGQIDEADTIRRDRDDMAHDVALAEQDISRANIVIAELEEQLSKEKESLFTRNEELASMKEAFEKITVPDVESIKSNLSQIEDINAKVRENKVYSEKKEKVALKEKNHSTLEKDIMVIKQQQTNLLIGAKMPLEGLSIRLGELVYNDIAWDGMSGSEQLIVATSIVKALNPECGFVLLDKLEQMDMDSLKAFGLWAKTQGLQIIATRVSTGDECTLIIEDGEIKND